MVPFLIAGHIYNDRCIYRVEFHGGSGFCQGLSSAMLLSTYMLKVLQQWGHALSPNIGSAATELNSHPA